MIRQVLMLAYFYPPNSGGGVPRTIKFIKYLSRLGWRSTVIAPAWPHDPATDADFARWLPEDTACIRAGTGADDGAVWKLMHRMPLFWRIEGRVRESFQYPDRFAVWARTALPAARTALMQHQYQILYSTSPPVTSHWIALRLKREFGLPWVADLRDPWTDNPILYGNPPAWRRRLDLRLEHQVYREADCIIANTPANRSMLIERHGVPAEKVVTITNGFDEEDFVGLVGTPPSDRFRITYCGSFYGPYNPAAFIVGLKALLERRSDAAIEVTLAGSAAEWATANIRDVALLHHFDLRGPIPNRDVYKLLAESHMLLHTYPSGIPNSVPGKLYEYMRSGRPIVAVCDRPSEVASLLDETVLGQAFRPDETQRLSAYIEAEFVNWKRGEWRPAAIAPAAALRRFERSALTRQLVDVFEKISDPTAEMSS